MIIITRWKHVSCQTQSSFFAKGPFWEEKVSLWIRSNSWCQKRKEPAVIYLFKVNNRNRTTYEIWSAPKRSHWFLLLNVNLFSTLFWCFHCWMGTSKRLISKFMTSQPDQQTIKIHILTNISRIKGNQTMKMFIW